MDIITKVIIFCGILFMTFLGSLGALFLKKAAKEIKNFTVMTVIKCIPLYIGIFLYSLGILLNIILLFYIEYTILYPLSSITYLWTMCLSYYYFKEKITTKKIIGISLIIFGAMMLYIIP